MNQKLYAIYDKKMTNYGPPMPAHNDGHAIRLMTDFMSQPNSVFVRYPADFEIWKLGEYNNLTGEITTTGKGLLCNAIDLFSPQIIEDAKNALFTQQQVKENTSEKIKKPKNLSGSDHKLPKKKEKGSKNAKMANNRPGNTGHN